MAQKYITTITEDNVTYKIKDTESRSIIGNITDLNTSNKNNIVSALNEIKDAGNEIIAQPEAPADIKKIWLDTDDNSIINAIEIDKTLTKSGKAADAKIVGSIIGDISVLNTNNKNDIVSAINEVKQISEMGQPEVVSQPEAPNDTTKLWLDTDDNNGKGMAPVDKTLSIEGMAADAKIVGRRFNSLDKYKDSFKTGRNLYDDLQTIEGVKLNNDGTYTIEPRFSISQTFILKPNMKIFTSAEMSINNGEYMRRTALSVRMNYILNPDGSVYENNKDQMTAYEYTNNTNEDIRICFLLWNNDPTYKVRKYMIEIVPSTESSKINPYESYTIDFKTDTTLSNPKLAANSAVVGENIKELRKITTESRNIYQPSTDTIGKSLSGNGTEVDDPRYSLTKEFKILPGQSIFTSAIYHLKTKPWPSNRQMENSVRMYYIFDRPGHISKIVNDTALSYKYTNNGNSSVNIRFLLYLNHPDIEVKDLMIELVDNENDIKINPYIPGIIINTDKTLTSEYIPANASVIGNTINDITVNNLYNQDNDKIKSYLNTDGTYIADNRYSVSQTFTVPAGMIIFSSALHKRKSDGWPSNRQMVNSVRMCYQVNSDGKILHTENVASNAHIFENKTGTDAYIRFLLWYDHPDEDNKDLMIEIVKSKDDVAIHQYVPFGKHYIKTASDLQNEYLPINTKILKDSIYDSFGFSLQSREIFHSEVQDTVEKILLHTNAPCTVLTMFTDIHVDINNEESMRCALDTASNIHAVTSKVYTNAIIGTGDYIWPNKQEVDQSISDRTISMIRGYAMQSSDRVYMINGNHDGPKGGPPKTTNYNGMSSHNRAYTVREGSSNYSYSDLEADKIRLIFLDTNALIDGVQTWGVANKQLTWLRQTLSTVPSGWNIMIFSHISPSNPYDFKQNRSETTKELNDFNNHSGSYTENTGKVLGWFCGHEHFDWIPSKDKSLCDFPVVVMTAAMPSGYTPKPEYTGAIYVPREKNTINQDAWTTIIYRPDENKIYLIRFGAGNDNVINLT